MRTYVAHGFDSEGAPSELPYHNPSAPDTLFGGDGWSAMILLAVAETPGSGIPRVDTISTPNGGQYVVRRHRLADAAVTSKDLDVSWSHAEAYVWGRQDAGDELARAIEPLRFADAYTTRQLQFQTGQSHFMPTVAAAFASYRDTGSIPS